MIPDFDDIVFERLNKTYGAYSLRKRYNGVLSFSIIAAIILGCIIVLIPFFSIPEQKSKEIYTYKFVTVDNLPAPDERAGIPPAPKPDVPTLAEAPPLHKAYEIKYIAPIVVDTILPVEELTASSADSISDGIEGQGISTGAGNGTSTLSGLSTGESGEGGVGTGNGLYLKVEIMPTFKGGDLNKFREWVQKKTVYPQIATINGIQGKVYITFVIERDGSISNVKVAKGVDPLIDNEALKSVMSSPKWTPGKLKGIAVRVSYIISVNFEL